MNPREAPGSRKINAECGQFCNGWRRVGLFGEIKEVGKHRGGHEKKSYSVRKIKESRKEVKKGIRKSIELLIKPEEWHLLLRVIGNKTPLSDGAINVAASHYRGDYI